jgi:hypothetical protein
MGVGFAFGGRDSGLTKIATKAAGALGALTGAAAGLNARFNASMKPLEELKNRFLAFKNALPENLTTSYEAQLVAADKAGRQLGANLGYSTKEMGRFSREATSLSIGLNRSTEEAGKAIYAWERGADVLKMVGIDSKETALKVQDVFGVDMSKFVFTLKEMQSSLGMDNAAIKRLTDSTLAWGQQSGDVNKALSGMQEQVNSLQKRAHAFGRTLSGGELAEWAESSNQAKQLLFALGNNAEKAESTVQALNEQFLETGRNMGKMFAGTASDLTDWQKHFAIAGVDISGQFDLMRQGPLGFIKGMSTMVQKAGGFANMTEEQMNFIKRQMEEALGPEVADQLFNVFKQGDSAVSDMIAKLPKATEDMGKLAKAGFRTGRTLAESMELARNQFVAVLRSGQEEQEYLKAAQKGYRDAGKQIKAFAAEKGPLGLLTNKFIQLHKFGFAGLVPDKFRAQFLVFETLGKEFGPILMGLGQMLPLLSALASPIVLVVAAFAGLVFWFKSAQKEGDSFSDTVTTMTAQANMFFNNMEGWLGERFPKHVKTIHLVMEGVRVGFQFIADATTLAVEGFSALFDFVEASLNGEVNSLTDFGDTVRNIWKYEIVEPIKLYFKNLWLDIKTEAKNVWDGLTESVKVAVDFWGKILKDSIATMVAPFEAIDKWVDKLFRNSIDTDMKETFAIAGRHADKFAANMSSSMTTATAPLSALTGNVSVSPGGGVTRLPPPIRPPPTVRAEDREAALLNAVNSPHWYSRYEQLFNQRIGAVEQLLRANAAQTAQGGRTAPPPPKKPKGGGRRPPDMGLHKTVQGDFTGHPGGED